MNRLEEEENNPMQALENKAVDSKREMDILDALQELKTRNARIERAGNNQEGLEKVLDRVSSGVEIGDRGVVKMLSEFEEKKKREEEEDEEEIRKVFGRAYLAGVPDIELEGAAGGGSSGSESEEDSPGTPKDGESLPTSSSTSTTTKLDKGKGKEAAVKRKLDVVEPTPADLLSAASKSIVAKSFGPGASGSGGSMAPPKKKSKGNSAMAKLMGLSFKK